MSLWADNMLVPNLATHQSNAEEWINYYYDPRWRRSSPTGTTTSARSRARRRRCSSPRTSKRPRATLIFPDDKMLDEHLRLHGAERPAGDPIRKGLGRCHIWLSRPRPQSSSGDQSAGPRAARPDQGLRRVQGRRRPRPRRTEGLVLRPARAVRLWQDHDPADGRGPRDPDLGHDPARRARHHLREALPAAGQHGLPELRAVPTPRHLRERRLRPPPAQGVRRRRRGAPDARAGRADHPDPQAACPALRWPAAARRPGPGPDQQARGAAARRAARCARPQAASRDADRAQAHPDRGRHHVHPRHPRPGGGHDHGRHHRGDERRRDRADGFARRALREPPARRSWRTSSASPT